MVPCLSHLTPPSHTPGCSRRAMSAPLNTVMKRRCRLVCCRQSRRSSMAGRLRAEGSGGGKCVGWGATKEGGGLCVGTAWVWENHPCARGFEGQGKPSRGWMQARLRSPSHCASSACTGPCAHPTRWHPRPAPTTPAPAPHSPPTTPTLAPDPPPIHTLTPTPIWVVHHNVKHVAYARTTHTLIHIVAQARPPCRQRALAGCLRKWRVRGMVAGRMAQV